MQQNLWYRKVQEEVSNIHDKRLIWPAWIPSQILYVSVTFQVFQEGIIWGSSVKLAEPTTLFLIKLFFFFLWKVGFFYEIPSPSINFLHVREDEVHDGKKLLI